MKVLLHAPSARIGGALNYITAIAPELAAAAPHCEFLAVLPASSVPQVPGAENFRVIPVHDTGTVRRLWFDQIVLRKLLKAEKIDVLFSTANTGMLAPPCRQVLLVRNSLFFSAIYGKRILPLKGRKRRISHELRRTLVTSSIQSSDVVMAPSQAMMDEVRREVQLPDSKAVVNHYGVDVWRFRPKAPRTSTGCPRLLFTGLYSEHKNLATLFDAMLHLQRAEIPCRLITPADPAWEGLSNPIRDQDTLRAQKLRASDRMEFTGVLSGSEVAALYGQADVFVYPCVVESFGHPLLEAMAAGLPVIAADTAVNRELCGDAAIYFSPFDSREFAQRIAHVLRDRELREDLCRRGTKQVSSFQWSMHVRKLLTAFGIVQEQRVSA
jgi:glycosyltransferase involved in cell wall biosynthesis